MRIHRIEITLSPLCIAGDAANALPRSSHETLLSLQLQKYIRRKRSYQ